tara:strand:- start:213 stop:419 length:207 start_codon:yes stop_codon:yes gene_type:complete
MEYESVAELSRYAIESFTDPVIIVNPIQWKDWSNQELDVFLSKETKLTHVVVIERDAWISALLGEENV